MGGEGRGAEDELYVVEVFEEAMVGVGSGAECR